MQCLPDPLCNTSSGVSTLCAAWCSAGWHPVQLAPFQFCSSVAFAFLSAESGLQVRILRKLHHRNIVQFYGACLEPGSMFFVTELMKVSSAVEAADVMWLSCV